MFTIKEKYIENIKNGMLFILSRDVDVTDALLETEDGCWLAEDLSIDYLNNFRTLYIVFILGKVYCVDGILCKDDAQFVMNNVDKIDYLYCDTDRWDTVFGDDLKTRLPNHPLCRLMFRDLLLNCSQTPTRDYLLQKIKEMN